MRTAANLGRRLGASDPDRWSLSNRFSNLSASFLGGSEARSTPSAMNPAGGPAGTAADPVSRKGRTTMTRRRRRRQTGDFGGRLAGAQGVERPNARRW